MKLDVLSGQSAHLFRDGTVPSVYEECYKTVRFYHSVKRYLSEINNPQHSCVGTAPFHIYVDWFRPEKIGEFAAELFPFLIAA